MNETWTKSSYSANTTSCVETRRTRDGADVRDSKNSDRGYIRFGAQAWQMYVTSIGGRR